MQVLITGVAGFIGFHLAKLLLAEGQQVIGLDNLNDYYEVSLKEARLHLLEHTNFKFYKGDLANLADLEQIFAKHQISHVVNLAAQAGVRYSLINPASYIQSNLVGFANLLELCRQYQIAHLVFASSSSVYGLNMKQPFAETDNVDHPASLYAATKKSNELMAHSYSHLYNLACTGLRFFTVYGPWGRPDMAPQIFSHAIMKGETVKLFNNGNMQRDFTYIDDIVQGIACILDKIPEKNPDWDQTKADPATSSAPWRIYNIGNNQTVALRDFLATLEKYLGKKAQCELYPMQAGDVTATWAKIDALSQFGFSPKTSLDQGIEKFVAWFKDYYHYV